MLLGEYNHNIDDKGRLIIPAKCREELGDTVYLCKGREGCIYLYPQDAWTDFVDEITESSRNKKDARKIQRYYFGSASETNFDKQGRVLVTTKLREHGNLTKDVVLIGMNDHMEIWDLDRWEENDDISEEELDEIEERSEED